MSDFEITAEPEEIAARAMETLSEAQVAACEEVRVVIGQVTLTGNQAHRFLGVHAALGAAAGWSREETLRYLVYLGLEHEARKMREVMDLVQGAPEHAQ